VGRRFSSRRLTTKEIGREEQKIFEEFKNILRAYTKDPALLEKATKETHILKDLKVNSARLVDVIIKCEDTFGVTIDDEEADKIGTIGDAMTLIAKKLG
jgi:acyl carrier protein